MEMTALKCSNCSRTRLLEIFSKSQRRRQNDGGLICREYRKLLDTELVIDWLEDDDDDDDDDDGGDGDKGESLFGHDGFGKMTFDWTVDVEKGDSEWHNGSLNDIFL